MPSLRVMSSPADYIGRVQPDRGLGVQRMADPRVLGRIHELAGFTIVPGTLNVGLDQPFTRSPTTEYLASSELFPGWEAETGQAGYFFVLVTIAGQYRGVAMQADELGYPPDLVELMCEVHLRQTLDLSDGREIRFTAQDA